MITSKNRAARWLLPLIVVLELALAGCSNDTPESLLASGKVLATKGEQSAAIIQFKAALQQDPRLTEARVQLGRSLLAAGDPVGAGVELARALDEKGPAVEVTLALAKALVLAGDYKKGTTLLGALTLDDKPAQAELKVQIAKAWGALGDREMTKAAIDAALAAVSDYGPALILRARVLAGQGKYEDAIRLLDQVLQQPDKLPEAWHLKGEIQEFTPDSGKAAAASYKEALKIDPAFTPAHFALINQSIRARDLPSAKQQVDLLRKLLPNHPTTALVDAQLALLERNLPLAREKAQALLRSYPNDVAVLVVSGSIETELGHMLQAQAHLAKAVQLNPDSWVARHNLADVYINLGQPAKALATVKPLLEVSSPRAEILAIAGQAAIGQGDASAAESYFARASKAAPGDNQVQTAAALTKFARGDSASAFAELESLASRSSETYANEAMFSARMRRGEFDAALQALDEIQRKAPRRGGVMELRGLVHLAKNDLLAARQAFDQALQETKGSVSAIAGLTRVDVAEGKHDQALQRLNVSLNADPRNHYFLMAIAQLKSTMGAPPDEIKTALLEAIKLAPTESQPRLLLMDQLLRKRQLREALAVAQDASAALPNDVRVLHGVGRVQMAAGALEQATITYRKIASLDPNSAAAYIRLAEVLRAAGRGPQAEAALRKALEIIPDLLQAQGALLDLLMSSGQRAEALALAKKLQSDRPQQPQGYLLEGAYHARGKANDAAIAVYRTGLTKTNHSEIAKSLYLELLNVGRNAEANQFSVQWMRANPKDAAFDYLLAEQHLERKDYADAEARLRRVLKIYPDNARALNNLSWALSQQSKPGSVAPALRAAALAPDNPDILDTLAIAQAAEGQGGRALATLQRAIELAPQNHDLQLSLAKIALKAGNKDIARIALKRLQDLGAAYPQQAEVARLSQSL